MNQKSFASIILVLAIVIVVAIGGYLLFCKKPAMPIAENNFQYDEVIKNKIGINGGVLQNTEKSIIITIPPLRQETEFTLSFKRSNFEVRSGVGSPVTISIYPDINLMNTPTPIKIKVKYNSQYNLPMAYLIDEKNKLHAVDIVEWDKENHYFTMCTFHGGDYSWIYATE